MDVSVNMQRKFQQSMPIDKEGASDSVHRQSVGHSCYATETGTFLGRLHGSVSAETGDVPQLQYMTRWSISLFSRTSTRFGRPRDLAATSSSISRRQCEVPQIQSSTVVRRFFAHFAPFFGLLLAD